MTLTWPSYTRSPPTSGASRSARPGLDYYRDCAPRADQERAFAAQIELARETGKPLVIHTRAADDATLAMLAERAAGLARDPPLLLDARRIEECLAHPRLVVLVRRQLTYPKADALRAAALRVPLDRLLVETDAPYLAPQALRGKPNQPANVVYTAKALASSGGSRTRSWKRRSNGTRGGVRMVSSRRARALGQNFLVDRNLLDVIERLAELEPDDVVLEIGGGPGVLSERWRRAWPCARRRARSALEAGLRERSADSPMRPCTWATPWRSTSPPSTGADKVVANLPYGDRRDGDAAHDRGAPDVTSWVVMVQREVGERLAAAPGTAAYGAPSVLAQLAGEVRVRAPCRAQRVPAGARTSTRCWSGYAHGPARRSPSSGRSCTTRSPTAARRSPGRSRSRLTPPGTSAIAPAPPWSRSVTRPMSAPSASSPEEFRELAARLSGDHELGARAGQGQPLPVARAVREDGRHELVTLFESVSLADELELTC